METWRTSTTKLLPKRPLQRQVQLARGSGSVDKPWQEAALPAWSVDEGEVGRMVTTYDDLISRYGELLGPEYSEEVVRARSTDTDRTLMSAQVSLAGEAQCLSAHHLMLVFVT